MQTAGHAIRLLHRRSDLAEEHRSARAARSRSMKVKTVLDDRPPSWRTERWTLPMFSRVGLRTAIATPLAPRPVGREVSFAIDRLKRFHYS
jgi:hypothetical protein